MSQNVLMESLDYVSIIDIVFCELSLDTDLLA